MHEYPCVSNLEKHHFCFPFILRRLLSEMLIKYAGVYLCAPNAFVHGIWDSNTFFHGIELSRLGLVLVVFVDVRHLSWGCC